MRDIKQLHPTLQKKVEQLKVLCAQNGIIIGISECLRTVAEQDALYAKGRTAAGSIVTNCKGATYSSMHQWGVAFDFYLLVDVDGDGQTSDDAFNNSTGLFDMVGALGQSIGLEWGGTWKSFVDKCHFQLPDWGSTASKLKSIYGTPNKFFATWNTASNVEQTESSYAPSYTVGKVYTLQSEMRVRTGAGINYAAKKYAQLTADGKKHDSDKDGALDKGTRVTCKEIKSVGNDIWMRTPSGWIAAFYNGKRYIK